MPLVVGDVTRPAFPRRPLPDDPVYRERGLDARGVRACVFVLCVCTTSATRAGGGRPPLALPPLPC